MLKGDFEVVLAAVSQNGKALQWASAELRGNREIVSSAVSQDGSALQWAAAELRLGPLATPLVLWPLAKAELLSSTF